MAGFSLPSLPLYPLARQPSPHDPPTHPLLPPPLSPCHPQVTTAHTAMPCAMTVVPPSGPSMRPQQPPCIPNITQVLAEIKEMGQGLVEDVVSAPSCKRMGA
jgi:hypothetical protein